MRIVSSELSLQANHQLTRYRETSETLNVWIGDRSPQTPAAPSVSVDISAQAQAAVEAERNEDTGVDSRLLLLKQLLEKLTGVHIHLLRPGDLRTSSAPAHSSAPEAPAPQSAPRPSAGYGIEYDRHSVESETEQTRFSASGSIVTADGKTLQFTLDLTMSRSFSEESSLSIRAGDARRKDPLVINFGGTAAQLTDQRISFDLDGDGQKEEMAQLAGNSGYLALDRNGNGSIDNGKELFGPVSGSGFGELRALDEDGNGWIDEGDAAFAKLIVWNPDVSGGGTATPLSKFGVGALFTGEVATPFDLRGSGNSDLGQVAASGVYLTESGQAGTLQEIDLTV